MKSMMMITMMVFGRFHDTLFGSVLLLLVVKVSMGSHIYRDSFPTLDEYDNIILDPNTVYGSPYGGFSRATASRLAKLPLKLPNIGESLDEFEPVFTEVRDFQGRSFVCRVYHEDEIQPSSLKDSVFDTVQLLPPKKKEPDNNNEKATDKEPSEDLPALPPISAATSKKQTQQAVKDDYFDEDDDDDDDDNDEEEEVTSQIVKDHDAENDAKEEATSNNNNNNINNNDLPTLEDLDESRVPDPMVMALNLNQELAAHLEGMCAQYHHGWWSYEWCYQDRVTQFHIEIKRKTKDVQEVELQDFTSLGTFSERQIEVVQSLMDRGGKVLQKGGETEIARVIDIFENGDICPATGKPRVTQVVMKCCPYGVMSKFTGGVLLNGKPHTTDLLAMQSLYESKTDICTYNATVCTPLLCASKDDEEEGASGVSKDGKASTTISSTSASASSTLSYKPSAGRKYMGSVLGSERPIQVTYDPKEVEQMSVREILVMTFGTDSKNCLQTEASGWWVYELCTWRYVRQFHEVTLIDRISGSSASDIVTQHLLGRYDAETYDKLTKETEWKFVVNATDATITAGGKSSSSASFRSPTAHGGNGAYFLQEFKGGEVCDHEDVTDSAIKAGAFGEGGIERATSVRFSCGNILALTVKEDSTCHYVADVTIPALCDHPFFKPPTSKKQIVKCLPAVPP